MSTDALYTIPQTQIQVDDDEASSTRTQGSASVSRSNSMATISIDHGNSEDSRVTACTSSSQSTSSYYSCASTPTRIDPPQAAGHSMPDPLLARSSPLFLSPRSTASQKVSSFRVSQLSVAPQSHDLSPASLSIISPPSSSSQPQSWSDSYGMDPSNTAVLSPSTYHSISASVDSAMGYTDLVPKPGTKSSAGREPEQPAYIPITPPPSYFEDDFTMYLHELLLAVLKDEQKHPQDEAENSGTRQHSYCSFSSGTKTPVIINRTAQSPDQDTQTQTPSDEHAEWETSWNPRTSEIVYDSTRDMDLDHGLDAHSGSIFRSCSCSECSSVWTSRTQSIRSISDSAQPQVSSFSNPKIGSSFPLFDSVTPSSNINTAYISNHDSIKISRSRPGSISSNSDLDSGSQQHPVWTSISPRDVSSMIYGYEERYTTATNESDDEAGDQGSFDTRRSRSMSSGSGAEFYSDVGIEDDTTPAPTPVQPKPKHKSKSKRCRSLGRESYKDLDNHEEEDELIIQPLNSDTTPGPPFKKRKIDVISASTRTLRSIRHRSKSTFAATEPASLRRGLSLKSLDDGGDAYTPRKVSSG